MNTSAKKQIIPELLAAVLWGILTLWTDRLFFRYDWRTTAFFVYKALFVLLAFLLVHGIVTLVKKLRAKDRFVWRWLQWTLPYLAVNLIVLLIVWPGCWGNDDLNVLSLARTLQGGNLPLPLHDYRNSCYTILLRCLCHQSIPVNGYDLSASWISGSGWQQVWRERSFSFCRLGYACNFWHIQ